MSAQILASLSAWTPGASLWITPFFADSRWTARIDWYLNFIILRTLDHSKRPLPPKLKKIIQDQEWTLPRMEMEDNMPILVSGQGRVPASKVLVLPFSNDLSGWIERGLQSTLQMNEKQVRIFLPKNADLEKAQKHCEPHASLLTAELIADLGDDPS